MGDLREGVGVDVVLEAFAGFEGGLDKIHGSLQRKRLRKVVGGAIISAGAGAQLLQINDRPAKGRFWQIVALGAYGNDPHTAVAGAIVDVYAGEPDSINIAGGFPDIVKGNLAVPSDTFFGEHGKWCKSGQTIFAIITGAAAAQNIELLAWVYEVKVSDEEPMEIT